VADGWCCFFLREEYCWLIAGGWFVLREKYCWLVADKPSEHAIILHDIFLRKLSDYSEEMAQGHVATCIGRQCTKWKPLHEVFYGTKYDMYNRLKRNSYVIEKDLYVRIRRLRLIL
jgi:hypothetical protein